jgi:ABC-type spermidine/putrescine transport system permease subunit I
MTVPDENSLPARHPLRPSMSGAHEYAMTLTGQPAKRAARPWRPDILWLAVPGALFLTAFLAYPSLKVLGLSLVQNNGTAFSTAAFERFAGPTVYARVLGTTFAIAWQTTAWCLLLGYPLAYWLSRLPTRRQQILALLVLLAFWTSALGFFITPTFLGSPREMMLGQLIIVQINDLQNWQMRSALAVVLVVTALVCCVAYDLVFGLSSLASAAGNAGSSRHRYLRRVGIGAANLMGSICSRLLLLHEWQPLRAPWLKAYSIALIVVLLFPIVAIVPMAFTDNTFLSFPPKGFSLRWFEAYFASPLWMTATVRSFGIGLATAIATSVFATLAALAVTRSASRLRGPAFLLFLTPMMVPSIVIAIGMFYLCASPCRSSRRDWPLPSSSVS